MALTREFLKGLGLEEDVIDKIIAQHKTTAGALSEANTSLEALRQENARLKPFEDQLKAEKARADKLDSDFTAYKAEIKSKEQNARLEAAYTALAKAAKVDDKYLKTVVNAARVDGILAKATLKEDGTFENADALTKGITETWPDFINAESTAGSNPATPPGGTHSEDDTFAAIAAAMGIKKE